MNNSDVIIYVSSPDSYSDVLDIYLRSFQKYWSQCPFELVLTTNTKNHEGLTCICNNKTDDTWIIRTLDYLPSIKAKYIILMCDDIFISQPVDTSKIKVMITYMEKNNIKYTRLEPLKNGAKIEGTMFSKVNKQVPYGINLQIGIFRKDFFEELLGDGSLSAWDIENKINTATSLSQPGFYDDIISVNNFVINYIHAIVKGKWLPTAWQFVQRNNLAYTTNRASHSKSEEFIMNLKILIRDFMSPKLRHHVKHTLTIIGFKFTSRY